MFIAAAASPVKAHLDFRTSWGQTMIFAVLKAWLMSPLHGIINCWVGTLRSITHVQTLRASYNVFRPMSELQHQGVVTHWLVW